MATATHRDRKRHDTKSPEGRSDAVVVADRMHSERTRCDIDSSGYDYWRLRVG